MKTMRTLLLAFLVCVLPLTTFAGVSSVYEIFTGSYYDSDGDGLGDLRGIESKLDYIQELGVDAVWLTPVSPSPSYHKYDVTDYRAVDPAFGTLADYEALADACRARGITLLFDLVINHTSWEHPWFVSAAESLRDGDLDNPYIAYYQFTQGAGDHPVEETDWYYAGDFGPHMPELNLDNPLVREEIQAIITFWLSHGAGGFRLDGVTHYYSGRPESNLEFLTWLNEAVKAINPDAFIVGEAWTNEAAILALYQSGIDALFDFPLSSTGSLSKAIQREAGQSFAARIADWQHKIDQINPSAYAAPFLSNHDQGRIAGVLRLDTRQEKQAAALYLLSPGVPFLYYGEELGMTGSGDDPNKRLPMLWSVTEKTGMCLPPEGATQNQRLQTGADAQGKDPDSLLSFYRRVLAFRRQYSIFVSGNAMMIETADARLAAFTLTEGGQTLLVAHNFAQDESLFMPSDGALLTVFDTGPEQSIEISGGVMLAPRSSAVWRLE